MTNVVKNILGRNKNLYNNLADVEKDFRLANRMGGNYTKKQYYEDSLDGEVETSHDKLLLKQWLRGK
jgi:hypothetical protein